MMSPDEERRVQACLGDWVYVADGQRLRVSAIGYKDGLRLDWERYVPGYDGSRSWRPEDRWSITSAETFAGDVEAGVYSTPSEDEERP